MNRLTLLLFFAALTGLSCGGKQPTKAYTDGYGSTSLALAKYLNPDYSPRPSSSDAAGDTVTYRWTDTELLISVPISANVPETADGDGFWFKMRLYEGLGWTGLRPTWAVFAKPTPRDGHEGVPDGQAAALDTAIIVAGAPGGSISDQVIGTATVQFLGDHYLVTVPIEGHTTAVFLSGWYEAGVYSGCPDCQAVQELRKYNAVILGAKRPSIVPE